MYVNPDQSINGKDNYFHPYKYGLTENKMLTYIPHHHVTSSLQMVSLMPWRDEI